MIFDMCFAIDCMNEEIKGCVRQLLQALQEGRRQKETQDLLKKASRFTEQVTSLTDSELKWSLFLKLKTQSYLNSELLNPLSVTDPRWLHPQWEITLKRRAFLCVSSWHCMYMYPTCSLVWNRLLLPASWCTGQTIITTVAQQNPKWRHTEIWWGLLLIGLFTNPISSLQ